MGKQTAKVEDIILGEVELHLVWRAPAIHSVVMHRLLALES